MMRVLHMIDELHLGGAQTHLRTLLKAWQRKPGYHHTVLSLFGDGVVGAQLREMGIEVKCLDLAGEIRSRRYLSVAGKIQNTIAGLKPDLVEAHLSYSRLIGLYAAARAGIPKRFAFEHGDVYLKSLGWRLANRFGQLTSNRVIAVSQAMADWMAETHGISRSRLMVLHNCIDPEGFQPSQKPAISRHDLGISGAAYVFCAVGSLGEGVNKRMDICIRALAETRRSETDALLLICGDGPLRPSLEGLAKELGVESFVKFLGLRQDVPDVLNMADAFCHAAPFEPFGLVCMEAMYMGLPVLVPDAGGIVEIVQHQSSGLKYPVLSWQALSEGMRRLMKDRASAKRMGAAGREYVVNHLTVDHYLKTLLEVYGV